MLPHFHCPFPSLVNPYAEVADRHTLDWVKRFDLVPCEREYQRLMASKFGGLAARAYPNAALEELQLASDWNTWLFIRDDDCDETGLGRDPAKLAQVHERLAEILLGDELSRSDLPLVHGLFDICGRLRRKADNAWMCRFTHSVIEYFDASVWEAQNRAANITPDPETYMMMRPYTGGLYTDIELIDVTEGLRLPLHVRKHEALQQLVRMANNVVCWSNDVLSFAKERRHNDVHNLVVTLHSHYGLSVPNAVQRAADMTNGEVRRFIALRERLPEFGADVDGDVGRFVAVLCSWMRGNLDWAYASGRYAVPADRDSSCAALLVE